MAIRSKPNAMHAPPASDDKKCNKQFNQRARDLKNGLSDLQKKVDKMKDGPEKQRLEASLTMLGTEGDHNGVGVAFSTLDGSAAGRTDLNLNASGQASPLITLDPDSGKNGSSTTLAINAAHEGTHLVDQTTELLHAYNELSWPNWIARSPTLSDFSLEYRGYQTSAWAAQALGVPSLAYDGGSSVIWNSSWAAADRQTLIDKGITQHVTSIPGHPETTPHNPWPN
jgi:hypothetical protein